MIAFDELKTKKNLLGFHDLIYYTNKLFAERPSICDRIASRFKLIMVDEMQVFTCSCSYSYSYSYSYSCLFN